MRLKRPLYPLYPRVIIPLRVFQKARPTKDRRTRMRSLVAQAYEEAMNVPVPIPAAS